MARKDLLWMGVSATLLFALMVVILRFYKERDPTEQHAFKAKRSEIVESPWRRAYRPR